MMSNYLELKHNTSYIELVVVFQNYLFFIIEINYDIN